MGYVRKTPAGTWRACWRDPSGRQPSKTFPTKREAVAFLADVESRRSHGSYVDPAAGRVRFAGYAETWLTGRTYERTTTARDTSVIRTHLLPRWGTTPLGRIDHSTVQQWVGELSVSLAPATVAQCHRLLSAILRSAVRDRLIPASPCEGVRLPRQRRTADHDQTTSREVFLGLLLPTVPDRWRALVGLAGGTGLRWGECAGLRWDAVDLDARLVYVVRVAVEVAGHVTDKPFPKSKAGRRVVPLPAFVVQLLREHRDRYEPGPAGQVFTNEAGGPPRRTLFRSCVWRPALVRAGLLGTVRQVGPDSWAATWPTVDGSTATQRLGSERDAVAVVARSAHGGLRFHDLRHSYATWLISDGVPINDVQRVMGHEQASTTLNMYTHAASQQDRYERVLGSFAAFSLPMPAQTPESPARSRGEPGSELG
jgi:integrase